jgi:hypothetical protein
MSGGLRGYCLAMAELHEDSSADTSRFQAFVQRTDEAPPPAWKMGASGVKIGLLAGIVVVVAAVAALIAWGFA